MSDKDNDEEVAEATNDQPGPEDKPASAEEAVATTDSPEKTGSSAGSTVAWLSFLVAIIALAAAGYTAWQSWQSTSDTGTEDSIARLDSRLSSSAEALADLENQVAELGRRDPGIDAELDTLRQEFDQRIRMLDSLPARMSDLESTIASLAGVSEGARDAWVLAEAEYYLQIANAQLQLANNPHLATMALSMADERIVQLSDPGLTDVRRAIADELAELEVMEKPDIEGAALTLASLARVVESLPLVDAAEETDDDDAVDPELSGPRRAWESVKGAMSGLVKVTPPERARLIQLSPDTEYFLRANIALQLQAARLALLRGEQAIFEQTIDDTTMLLNEYFDADSAQVAGALETLAEIRGHVFTTDVPDISESLRLLRQFRTLNESAQ
jgi:uroporphyrin-3 C-methyltransferase